MHGRIQKDKHLAFPHCHTSLLLNVFFKDKSCFSGMIKNVAKWWCFLPKSVVFQSESMPKKLGELQVKVISLDDTRSANNVWIIISIILAVITIVTLLINIQKDNEIDALEYEVEHLLDIIFDNNGDVVFRSGDKFKEIKDEWDKRIK